MFCPECGKINPDNEEICSGCGAKLKTEAAEPVSKPKRGFAKMIITAVIVVAAVVVAVILLNGCGNSEMVKNPMAF